MGGPCIAPREGQGQDTGRSGGVLPKTTGIKTQVRACASAQEQKRGHLQHQTMTQTEEGWPGFSALSISMTGAVLGSWLVVPLS